jgi:hypothetical protein
VIEEAIITPYSSCLAERAAGWRLRMDKWAAQQRSNAIKEVNTTARIALGALDAVNTIASSEPVGVVPLGLVCILGLGDNFPDLLKHYELGLRV